MHELAVQFRAGHLYLHNAHNIGSKGPSFFSDHAWFETSYKAFEEAYDKVVERMIGLGYDVNLQSIIKSAAKEAASYSTAVMTPELCFRTQLKLEQEICAMIRNYVPNVDDGTQNLLQGLADESLDRQYAIKQRLS